jgi:branched-chain amino acid aminotransferase
MPIPYSPAQINDAILLTIRKNELQECYIRPIVYRGYGEMGLDPRKCPVEVCIAVWEWGKYLGAKSCEVMVSSWRRPAPNTFPALAKAGANYMNSQLIKLEAVSYGFVEGVALSIEGYISEGSAENIFLVKNGIIYTPSIGSSILAGITRDSVIKIARDLGYLVKEEFIPREFLYLADEVFLTGTAAEITPISAVDKIPVGDGKPGPVTKKIQEEFEKIIRGKVKKRLAWLTFI